MSMFGTMLVQYAIMWHIVLKTQSGSMIMLYIIVGVLPIFFTSFLGGVWADRYNKKHLINISDGAIGFISLAIAISLFAGYDSMILLLIAATVRASGQGIQSPAVASLIPLIVPEDKLLKINGINSSIQSGILLLSPMAAASLMMIAPLEALFFIDVITAAIAIGILYFLVKAPHTERKNGDAEKTSIFAELVNGLRYIKSQKYLLWFFVLFALFTIFMSPLCFLWHLQVTRNFGADVWRLSAVEIVNAGGMMLGGALVGIWSFRNKIHSIGMASIVVGIMTILFGVWTNFIPYLVCMAIMGIATPYVIAPSTTLIQEKVAPDYLGRVLSVYTMLGTVIMPMGMLIFGPLADSININQIFIGVGVVMVLLGTLYFVSKTLRAAGS